jgi:hypothetical protein
MNEYELLCEREKQLLLNSTIGNNKTAKYDDNYSSSDSNHLNNTSLTITTNSSHNIDNKKSLNSPTMKCKSLDVSLEDVLNCNDITIETSDELNNEEIKCIDSSFDQLINDQFESSATLPRVKKCITQSKSLPVSTATSFDCLSDDNCQTNHSMADDRDFVTKL